MRQHFKPLIIRDNEEALELDRVQLEASSEQFSEDWVQSLIAANPKVLPLHEIEPAFDFLISAAREVPVSVGNIDNVFITPTGGIVVVECKLWRNPQARREAISQMLDYARCLSEMSYEEFESTIIKTSKSHSSLWSFVEEASELSEAEYVDAVAKNLRLGRFLLCLVGDGIRTEAESLTDFVQLHAGAHFQLAMVEISVWQLPDGGRVIFPRIPVRISTVKRGVVDIKNSDLLVKSSTEYIRKSDEESSLTREEFFEGLNLDFQGLRRLENFLQKISESGIEPTYMKSLNLKWHAPDGREINFGYIQKTGRVWTSPISWKMHSTSEKNLARSYVHHVARAIDGSVRVANNQTGDPETAGPDGKAPHISLMLDHGTEWLQAIITFQREYRELVDV